MAKELIEALAKLDEKEVLSLTKRRLGENENPSAILQEVKEGMDIVGKKYESGEFFLGELMFSGEILKQVTALIKPKLAQADSGDSMGTVVMGSVEGDLHDIGKNIVCFLLETYGFEVIDLGVDVAPANFVEKIKSSNAGYVGLSGLLTAAIDSMKNTVETIRKDVPGELKIIIGGSPIDETVMKYTGADEYGRDALDGVGKVKTWASKYQR